MIAPARFMRGQVDLAGHGVGTLAGHGCALPTASMKNFFSHGRLA